MLRLFISGVTRERKREREREGGGTDRQIDIQMTYIYFQNSFE